MRRANGVETVLNGAAGEFGLVTVATEMTEINMFQFGSDEIGKNGRGGVVAEMTMATHDALLDAPRTL